jgi:hypothetical protein
MRDLAALLSAAGIDLSGWSLRAAVDVSADGSVVVGIGLDPQGRYEGWIAGLPVALPFTGFFAPVGNPLVLNAMKAGAAVPIKFSLSGDRGLGVMAAGFPTSQQIACPGGVSVAPIQELTLTAGNSTLNYDVATDTYTYAWKTDKAWTSTCRRLNVRLTDGTDHNAVFMFK